MRVLYVQYANPATYPPLEHSSRILASAGAQVLFLGTGSLGADSLRFPSHENIEVRQWKFCPPGWRQKLHYVQFGLWVLCTALRWRPDWIYASDPLACPVALLLSYLPRWRMLYHEHDSPSKWRVASGEWRGKEGEGRGKREEGRGEDTGASRFMRFVLWTRGKLARRAALCVLPNEKRVEHFRQETSTQRPVLCVWNCPRREEAGTTPPPRPQSEFILFYHGSIVPARVPLSVVQALVSLPQQVRLQIAGYETIGHRGYIRQVQGEAKRLGISGRVEILGALPFRAGLLQRCQAAHVGLSLMPKLGPDLNEQTMAGASNKPFDYLACGAALLVSDLPDWQKMFVEPGYGLACDPADLASIADAIRWFLEHPEETRLMGERGRVRILEEWNYERQFRRVQDGLGNRNKLHP
jgi:glycosyltransferase involved in cell wall biosynthesis